MTAETLVDAATGAALIAIVAVYAVLLIGTLVCALKGDVPKAILCGMALLTMLWPGLGFIVLIVILIVALCTRNFELIAPVAIGFVLVLVIYLVLAAVIGVGAVLIGGSTV